ncbi:MAG: glycosyltransferase [Oscillospiraceae bacterium]|jgi:glycosyltransferase involved in cell wall biosynthesis|nr:glycosyltransferase [Oscillospiraceae bacterium]
MQPNVALITDSFPPIIDGVCNCVLNYARILNFRRDGSCAVVTQKMPGGQYSQYPYPVLTYPSMPIPKVAYRAGYPFVPTLAAKLKKLNIDILHAHSPFTAMTISRQLRMLLKVPVVVTQHTKWEYDIARIFPRYLRKPVERLVYGNISAADEVWSVSRSTAKHMSERGFGEFKSIVMENGTDFTRGDADPSLLRELNGRFGLNDERPVFLFVGRMMWYKNIRLIFRALDILRSNGLAFDMLMVGDGPDLSAIELLANEMDMGGHVHFAGRISDRERLRAYFTRADLMIFPSVFDNAPLVVREAAACRCPAVVINGSSTAEILLDNETGFFAAETPESVAETVRRAVSDKALLNLVADNAAEHVYVSWDDIVSRAVDRYGNIIEKYKTKC